MAESDVAFVCYPHAQSHPVVAELVDAGVRVVDSQRRLPADGPGRLPGVVRVRRIPRPDLVRGGRLRAARGLPAEVRDARLVANPGCFPTGMLLGLLPLARRWGCLLPSSSTRSRGSPARDARPPTRPTSARCTTTSGPTARSAIGTPPRWPRNWPGGRDAQVRVSFTPHLLPVDRGILSTVYCRWPMPAEDVVVRGRPLRSLPGLLRGGALRRGGRRTPGPARGAADELLPPGRAGRPRLPGWSR